jgi:hypothetical protein
MEDALLVLDFFGWKMLHKQLQYLEQWQRQLNIAIGMKRAEEKFHKRSHKACKSIKCLLFIFR